MRLVRRVPGVYADLVTAAGFKPVVASERRRGGFDSHPLPSGGFCRPLANSRTVLQPVAQSGVPATRLKLQ